MSFYKDIRGNFRAPLLHRGFLWDFHKHEIFAKSKMAMEKIFFLKSENLTENYENYGKLRKITENYENYGKLRKLRKFVI